MNKLKRLESSCLTTSLYILPTYNSFIIKHIINNILIVKKKKRHNTKLVYIHKHKATISIDLQHITSLRSLYLRRGEGAPVAGFFPFSELISSGRSLPPATFPATNFLEVTPLCLIFLSSLWHQSHSSIGSDDSL